MDEFNKNKQEEVFSKRIRAGKKRTYFFDVKTTKSNDFYLTITESKRDFRNQDSYIKHKIFVYKEDFNKFLQALTETIDYVKNELNPDFQYDQFDNNQQNNFSSFEDDGFNVFEEDDADLK